MNEKWRDRLLDLAFHVAAWSKDDSSQVGAVIAEGKRVVSIGFNGYPAGVNDEILSRDQKILRTVHAEINASIFARSSIEGCSIYITHPPCSQCTAHLIQRGVKEICWYEQDEHFLERWKASYEESMKMMSEAGVIAMQRDRT